MEMKPSATATRSVSAFCGHVHHAHVALLVDMGQAAARSSIRSPCRSESIRWSSRVRLGARRQVRRSGGPEARELSRTQLIWRHGALGAQRAVGRLGRKLAADLAQILGRYPLVVASSGLARAVAALAHPASPARRLSYSYSCRENRHGRSLPSAVRRRRLHSPQKWRDSG